MKMKIVILSNNRADNVITLKRMPRYIQDMTSIIVYPNQIDEYKLHNPTVNLIPSPDGVKGIAARREWICNHVGEGIVWMIDDDISITKSFYDPNKPTVSNRKIHDDEWDELLSHIQLTIDCGYDVGGLFTRMAPLKRQYYPGMMMQRVNGNWWLNLDKIDLNGLDWTSIPNAEDFHIQAQLAIRGHQQLFLSTFSGTPTKTQTAGGCSDARSVETHNASMIRLNELYGDNCKLRTSKVLMDGQEKLKCTLKFSNISTLSSEVLKSTYNGFRKAFNAEDYDKENKTFYSYYDKKGRRIKP